MDDLDSDLKYSGYFRTYWSIPNPSGTYMVNGMHPVYGASIINHPPY